MSLKIKVSYTEDKEAAAILDLLKPVAGLFKIRKSEGSPPYKHLYFIPRKTETPRH